MYAIFEGQKIYQKKVIQNLPTLVAVEIFSLLPTLIASQRLNYYFFCHEILGTKNPLC